MSEHCSFYILDKNAPTDQRIIKALENHENCRSIEIGGKELLVWTEWINEVREMFGRPHDIGVDIKECKTEEERIFWPDGSEGYYKWLEDMVDKGYGYWINDEGWNTFER